LITIDTEPGDSRGRRSEDAAMMPGMFRVEVAA
jgi:hypothetical protein